MDPLLAACLAQLPASRTWSLHTRFLWLDMLEHTLDFLIRVKEEGKPEEDDELTFDLDKECIDSVKLPSGGEIVLSYYNVNLLTMSLEDRAWLLSFIDMFRNRKEQPVAALPVEPLLLETTLPATVTPAPVVAEEMDEEEEEEPNGVFLKRALTKEQEAELCARCNEPIETLMTEFEIAKNTIRRIWKRHGVVRDRSKLKHGNRYTVQKAKEPDAPVQSGDVKRDSAAPLLIESKTMGKARLLSLEQEQEVCKRYEEPALALAVEFSVDSETIRRTWQRYNINRADIIRKRSDQLTQQNKEGVA